MRAYRKGNVALANAIGTGVADDKAVYAYVPRLIRYYLDQDPIIHNVETRICREPDALAYTLDHLAELVVKPVGESGGYGITIGPRATKGELALARERLLADPANYISQPMIDLSVSPTLVDGAVEPRHVDLRPFAVTGRDTWVLPGGLSRVALSAARWWSTPPRAAGPRTPGSWRSAPHDPPAVALGREPVLARPLHRARPRISPASSTSRRPSPATAAAPGLAGRW